MKVNNIIIINSHGCNRGDEAAQRAMIAGVLEKYPECKIEIITDSPEGLDLPAGIPKIRTLQFSLKRLLLLAAVIICKKLNLVLPDYFKKRDGYKVFQALIESDIIISSPGGPYIGDLYADHELKEHLFLIFVSLILGKPIMIYAPSMGPFNLKFRNILRRYILNRVFLITVRDEISYKHLEKLKIKKTKIILTADSVFREPEEKFLKENEQVLQFVEDIKKQKLIGKKTIGFTPAGGAWNYRNENDARKKEVEYIDIIAQSLDGIIKKYDAIIFFFPQLYGDISDAPLMEKIRGKSEFPEKIFFVEKNFDSAAQKILIKEMDIFIGNRYHSIIFSIISRVPFVCLSYEHKSKAIVDFMGLGKYLINIKDINPRSINDAVTELFKNRESVKGIIDEKILKIKAAANLNNILFSHLIDFISEFGPKKKLFGLEMEKIANNFII
jgi:colanic acid/amylovoran biosynthesis protein